MSTDTTKPIWTRCIGCKQRVFNDQIDISAHKGNCPADLRRDLKNLAIRLDERISDLETAEPEPVTIPSEVAEWPDETETETDPDDFDDDPRSTYTDDTPAGTFTPAATGTIA